MAKISRKGIWKYCYWYLKLLKKNIYAFGKDTGLSSSSAWLSLCEHWPHSKQDRLCCEGHRIAKSFYSVFFLSATVHGVRKARLQMSDPSLRLSTAEAPPAPGPRERAAGVWSSAERGSSRPPRQAGAREGQRQLNNANVKAGCTGEWRAPSWLH